MVSHQELHSSILAFILSRHQSSSLMISHKCHQLVHHALGLFQSLPRIERFTPSRQLFGFHLFYAYNIFTGALFYRLIVTGCLTSRGSQPHDSLLAYLFNFMSTLIFIGYDLVIPFAQLCARLVVTCINLEDSLFRGAVLDGECIHSPTK